MSQKHDESSRGVSLPKQCLGGKKRGETKPREECGSSAERELEPDSERRQKRGPEAATRTRMAGRAIGRGPAREKDGAHRVRVRASEKGQEGMGEQSGRENVSRKRKRRKGKVAQAGRRSEGGAKVYGGLNWKEEGEQREKSKQTESTEQHGKKRERGTETAHNNKERARARA